MGNDGARELVGAYVREAPGKPGHQPGSQHGVGVAVGSGLDADEEVVGTGWHRHRDVGGQSIRLIVREQLLGAHLLWE